MEYQLLKIEGVDPEKITVLNEGEREDLSALYAQRDALLETNGMNLTQRRYAVRLKSAEGQAARRRKAG